MVPEAVKPSLEAHPARVKTIHERISPLVRPVQMPYALDRKYPNAPTEWGWQFLFPQEKRWWIPDGRAGAASRGSGDLQRVVKAAASRWNRQAWHLSDPAPLVCDAPRSRAATIFGPFRIAWAQGREDEIDLHPCLASGRQRGAKPSGRLVGATARQGCYTVSIHNPERIGPLAVNDSDLHGQCNTRAPVYCGRPVEISWQ